MYQFVIKNARLVNRGKIKELDVAIQNDRIAKIDNHIDAEAEREINASGLFVIPGIIDDQVHFREPGMTHKANIHTESLAAAAGGVTSFMEMPNTKPTATTQELLEDKYQIGRKTSAVNYSFYMGATNDNLEEVLKTNPGEVCGVKVFMGSSTGKMLVDDREVLDALFQKCPMLIATHCEDETTIENNLRTFTNRFGRDNLKAEHHPLIRSREGCLLSSSLAIDLAKSHGTKLHILHISTAEETQLFDRRSDNPNKHITAEACVHHLYFSEEDYANLGNWIKCNPAIKTAADREAIFNAVMEDRIDVIATDHAPHTAEEKTAPYYQSPSGLPLVQHGLLIMLDYYHRGKISLEKIVEKMCHSPAELFNIRERGYLDEGSKADLVLVDPNLTQKITPSSLLYKCGWSPLEGREFKGTVLKTFVNGKVVFENGKWTGAIAGQRLLFKK